MGTRNGKTIYQFEAKDALGQEIRDTISAKNEQEAQTTIRRMGYFVTKISAIKPDLTQSFPSKGNTVEEILRMARDDDSPKDEAKAAIDEELIFGFNNGIRESFPTAQSLKDKIKREKQQDKVQQETETLVAIQAGIAHAIEEHDTTVKFYFNLGICEQQGWDKIYHIPKERFTPDLKEFLVSKGYLVQADNEGFEVSLN